MKIKMKMEKGRGESQESKSDIKYSCKANALVSGFWVVQAIMLIQNLSIHLSNLHCPSQIQLYYYCYCYQ